MSFADKEHKGFVESITDLGLKGNLNMDNLDQVIIAIHNIHALEIQVNYWYNLPLRMPLYKRIIDWLYRTWESIAYSNDKKLTSTLWESITTRDIDMSGHLRFIHGVKGNNLSFEDISNHVLEEIKQDTMLPEFDGKWPDDTPVYRIRSKYLDVDFKVFGWYDLQFRDNSVIIKPNSEHRSITEHNKDAIIGTLERIPHFQDFGIKYIDQCNSNLQISN